PRFAYGRSIRNAIDRARMRQAGRLYADRENLTKEDLMTIKADDILASSLFGDEEGESPGDEDDGSSDGAKSNARGNES
ncbi:MAG: hypothetical protein QOJ46_481, partial [bacterium]